MPRSRKHFIHGSVVEICFRAEQGLVLPAAPLMRAIMVGLLARAQNLYPVTICHYVIMANHIHLIIVVDDPANVPKFMEYLKRESANRINRMLGRPRHTVWTAEYDSPVILDAAKAIERIVYIYTNPQRARLVRRMEDYPNLSSWEAFKANGREYTVSHFPRAAIPKNINREFALSGKILDDMTAQRSAKFTLKISPFAWINCFEGSRHSDPARLRAEIMARIDSCEKSLDRRHGTKVLGNAALVGSWIVVDYTPKKHGRKMICLGTESTTRARFIGWFKLCASEAKKAIFSWLQGFFTPIPPGFFAPGGALHSHINPLFTPLPLA